MRLLRGIREAWAYWAGVRRSGHTPAPPAMWGSLYTPTRCMDCGNKLDGVAPSPARLP